MRSIRVAALAALALAAAMPARAGAPHGAVILLLMSGDGGNPAGSGFVRGAREALPLAADAGSTPTLFTEFLDLNRFGSPEDRARAVASVSDKYATRPPDIILTYLDAATGVALDLRRVLRTDVPIVFVGADDHWLAPGQRPTRSTGMVLDARLGATRDFVRALLPGTRQFVVVNGATPLERSWQAGIERDWAERGFAEPLVPLAGTSLETVLVRLAALPPDAAVITVSLLSDGNGRSYEPRTVQSLLVAAANRPVFVASDLQMGSGAVGGLLYSPEAAGRAMMDRALRILSGAPADDLPLARARDIAVTAAVDARALARWGIPESRLPAGTVVQFPQPSLWRDHRGEVLVTLGALAVSIGMVTVLLAERRRRVRAEREAREQLSHAAFLDRRAALGELSASIAHDINQPLAAILNNAEAAALLLARPTPPVAELRDIVDDIRRDDQRAGDIVHRVRALLRHGELQRQPVDMRRLAQDTVALLHREAVAQATEITVSQPAPVPPVLGDPTHLRQLLLNLCLNALHAVRDVPGARAVAVAVTVSEGRVAVRVTDTGRGFTADALTRAFEPFYTTKADDAGMGMGLAIARRIADAHGGTIRAENLPEGGAAVTTVLPAADL